MADALELAFRRCAKRLIDPEQRWLIAVSGGGDSIALLQLLRPWFRRRPQNLVVAHLDHGLRRTSRADRRFVEQVAGELGLDCHCDRRAVSTLRRRGESPEEAARRVRRGFLLETLERTGCRGIVTGHTLDDQAETVLMRLARGSGATGLAGIAERNDPFVRPLLGLEREALRDWLRRHDLPWRDDPSNTDPRIDRNRVRRRLLPLMHETLNPRAALHIAQAAALLRADAEFLDALAEERLADDCRTDRSGQPVLRAGILTELAPVIAGRVALALLKRAGIDPRRIGRKQIDALLDLAQPPGNREIHLPGRLNARRVRGEIRFRPRPAESTARRKTH